MKKNAQIFFFYLEEQNALNTSIKNLKYEEKKFTDTAKMSFINIPKWIVKVYIKTYLKTYLNIYFHYLYTS